MKVLLFLLSIISIIDAEKLSLDYFPKPGTEFQACGHPDDYESWVCDPDKYLDGTMTKKIDDYITSLRDQSIVKCKAPPNKRSFQFGVAIISKFRNYDLIIPPKLTNRKDDKTALSETYAKKIHDYWGVGEHDCNNGAVLFMTIEDRYMYLSTGSALKHIISDDLVTNYIIAHLVRPLMRRKKYGESILTMLEVIAEILKHQDDLSKSVHYSEYKKLTQNYWFKIPFTDMEFDEGTAFFSFVIAGILGYGGYQLYSKREYNQCKSKLASIEAQMRAKKFDQKSCPICLEEFPVPNSDGSVEKKTSILVCGHRFCDECLDQWFASKSRADQRCPICRKHWSDYKPDNNDESKTDETDEKNDSGSNGDIRHRPNPPPHSSSHSGKTHSASAASETDSAFYDGSRQPLFSDADRNRDGAARQRQYRRNDNLFQTELLFRLMRMRHYYPRYVNNDMVNRWSTNRYSGSFTSDPSFVRTAPDYVPPRSSSGSGSSWGSGSRRSGGGFSFGGGSSRGGGGGGGGW